MQVRSNREVTYYGTDIVDRLNSAPVWGSAPLGLSLVWLRSLGHRRDDINYRPDSIPVGPNLRALSVVGQSGCETYNHVAKILTKGQEHAVIKQIEIHGQCFELYSPDDGRTWSSSPQSIVAYGRRKKKLRLELQKRFQRLDARQNRDPNQFRGLETPKSLK